MQVTGLGTPDFVRMLDAINGVALPENVQRSGAGALSLPHELTLSLMLLLNGIFLLL